MKNYKFFLIILSVLILVGFLVVTYLDMPAPDKLEIKVQFPHDGLTMKIPGPLSSYSVVDLNKSVSQNINITDLSLNFLYSVDLESLITFIIFFKSLNSNGFFAF